MAPWKKERAVAVLHLTQRDPFQVRSSNILSSGGCPTVLQTAGCLQSPIPMTCIKEMENGPRPDVEAV